MPRPPRPTWGIPIDQTPSPLLPSPPPPPPDGRHVAFPTLGDGFHVSPTSRRPPGSSSSTRTDSSSGSGRGVPKKKKKRHLHFPEDGLACDAEIVALAKIFKGFQEKMPAKIRSSNQENTYLDLYHHMDLDQSGVVDFDEFTWMIRSELHVVASSLPDASLRALWNSLDLDGSGTICFGEFGHFMRYLSREDEDGDDPLDASAGSPLSSPLGLRSLQQQKLQSAGGAGAASRAIMLSPTPSSGLARSAPKQWPRTLSSIPPATFDQARASLGPGKSHRDAGSRSVARGGAGGEHPLSSGNGNGNGTAGAAGAAWRGQETRMLPSGVILLGDRDTESLHGVEDPHVRFLLTQKLTGHFGAPSVRPPDAPSPVYCRRTSAA